MRGQSEKVENILWIAIILVLLTLVAYKHQQVEQSQVVQVETTYPVPDSDAANDELLGGREEPNQP